MWGLPKHIMEYSETLPEGAPLCPGALLHLSNRAAVDQALSRLARSGNLLRICQGVYMRPIKTRFGQCTPDTGKAIAALSALWGETIVPCGGSAANRLGLTTQNPVREVLSNVWLQSASAIWPTFGRVASCAALATNRPSQQSGCL